MKRFIPFFLLLVAAATFNGCSEDVDLNADYKSTTVVFGLLDPRDSVQWIKINRTFLGEGNNLDYARIRDSSEYRADEFQSIVVQEWENEQLIREHIVHDTVVSNKLVSGIFYGPEQTIYYFNTPLSANGTGLNEDATYRLVVDFVDRQDVSAETNLVRTSEIGFVSPQATSTLIMAQSQAGNNVSYNDATMKFTTGENVKLYDFTLRFKYTEIFNGNSTPMFIDYKIGSYEPDDTRGNVQTTYVFQGSGFFSFLGNRLSSINGMQRQIGFFDGARTRCFDIKLTVANEELATYIEVSSPITGVVQERPTYTNISNGLGLFASRSEVSIENIGLTGNNANGITQIGNLKALVIGEFTSDLGFCDPNPASDYSCN
jgi:hypothetical protein